MDVTADWFWEGNVVKAIARFLADEGWTIVGKADTHSKERGVDIHATRVGRTLVVEITPILAQRVEILAGASFAFDVERLELACHVFSIAKIRPPNQQSKATVCTMTRSNIAELAAIALVALLVVFAVDSNNRIQRRTV
jgi:hypothetical protein